MISLLILDLQLMILNIIRITDCIELIHLVDSTGLPSGVSASITGGYSLQVYQVLQQVEVAEPTTIV